MSKKEVFEKMDLETPDLTSENAKKLAELFPNCVTESRVNGVVKHSIDFDTLKQELSNDIAGDITERYQMTWPGKAESIIAGNAPIDKTLRPNREESVNFDTTENLFIEGDNLDALKLLQETYLGKVKMIYIDPPYNTGKDFVYSDNFTADRDEHNEDSDYVDEEGGRLVINTDSNGRFHSDWLSMIYPRLRLASNLLSDDGVIFISIDDNEQANLKKLCDETFGGANFIAELATVMNMKGNHDTFGFADTHEYTLVYSKRKDSCILEELKLTEEELKKWKNDEYGLYKKADTLRRTGQDAIREKRPNGWFPVFISKNDNIYVTENDKPLSNNDLILLPINDDSEELSWTWGKKKILSESYNLIVTGTEDDRNIYKKQRPKFGDIPTKKPKTLFFKPEYSTSTATKNLKKLLNHKVFEGTKPIPFLIDLITIGMGGDDIILDFFAGSGTTAHAVMALNAQDEGTRKCISVQLPETTDEKSEAYKAGYKNIADISKERIRRAGQKILADNSNSKESKDLSNLDIGFRVLKIDTGNRVGVKNTASETSQDSLFERVGNLKDGRTAEDLLFGCMLDWGVDLSLPIQAQEVAGKTVYGVYDRTDTAHNPPLLMACFDDSITDELTKAIAKDHKPMRMVFKDSSFNNNDSVKINTAEIFKALSPSTQVRVV